MTDSKKKRKYTRKTDAEKLAELEAKREELRRKVAIQRLESDPSAQRVVHALKNLDERRNIADRTLNGRGRGKGTSALDRAEALEAQARDLRVAYQRDMALMSPEVDAWNEALMAYQNGIIEGTIDPHEDPLPPAPDAFKNWKETESERIARIEREERERRNMLREDDIDDDDTDSDSDTSDSDDDADIVDQTITEITGIDG